MSEKQKEAIAKVVDALEQVPEEHRGAAAEVLAHDAQVLCKGIAIGAAVKPAG